MAEEIVSKETEELLNNMCYVANIAKLGTLIKQVVGGTQVDIQKKLDNKVDKVEGKGLSSNDFASTYKIKLDNLDTNLSTKVDKVVGKDLSTNDFTSAYKTKLDNLDTNLSAKANTSAVLTKTNTIAFTPTGDYQPATKKYVDDHSSNVKLADNLTTDDGTIALSAKQGKLLNDNKVDKSSVLLKDNTTEFTPTADYQPATKKYVDTLVADKGGGDMLRSMYDQNKSGVVDNSEKLDGHSASYFAKSSVNAVITLPPTEADWTKKTDSDGTSYYIKEFINESFTEEGKPLVDVKLSDIASTARGQIEAYGNVDRVVVTNGKAIVYCYDSIPTVSIDIQIIIIY